MESRRQEGEIQKAIRGSEHAYSMEETSRRDLSDDRRAYLRREVGEHRGKLGRNRGAEMPLTPSQKAMWAKLGKSGKFRKNRIIKYDKSLDIRNISSLPVGTGAKYLLVIRGQGNEYVAKAWHRKKPKKLGLGEMLIKFGK